MGAGMVSFEALIGTTDLKNAPGRRWPDRSLFARFVLTPIAQVYEWYDRLLWHFGWRHIWSTPCDFCGDGYVLYIAEWDDSTIERLCARCRSHSHDDGAKRLSLIRRGMSFRLRHTFPEGCRIRRSIRSNGIHRGGGENGRDADCHQNAGAVPPGGPMMAKLAMPGCAALLEMLLQSGFAVTVELASGRSFIDDRVMAMRSSPRAVPGPDDVEVEFRDAGWVPLEEITGLSGSASFAVSRGSF